MARFTRTDLIEERSIFLRRVPIFSELDEDALKEVTKKLQPISLPKGAILYHEGEPGDALYVIESGRVKIVSRDEGGEEKVINYLSRGDTFGGIALLTGSTRSVTAKVDSTANFLVLYKKDFESFLKKNPAASFYLSRLISKRLSVATKASLVPTMNPEVLGFYSELPKDDQIVFMVNVALSLTRQTRRRILLLVLGPQGSELVKSMGMSPILTSSSMLHAEDFRNPKTLEKLALAHPSGLEIVTLPEETFSGVLFRSIGPFISLLREIYDFAIIDFPAKGRTGGSSTARLNEIDRTILSECDWIYHVSSGDPADLTSFKSEFADAYNVKSISLRLGGSTSPPSDFSVPWSDQFPDLLRKGDPPYLTRPGMDPTQVRLDRIARAIGKLGVGLAMGSGAAYGYTLIGMIKVFEREKIPIDFISGTSMGALMGSFFAKGMTALEMESVAQSITKAWLRKSILSDLNLPWPHGGLLEGNTISRFLKKQLGDIEFKDLPTPFACSATDIMTGDGVVLKEGKVWQAVRASLSLPMIFCPYKFGNRFLVDGGLVNPVPTSIIASMGADILISINLTGKVSERRVSLRRLGMFPASSPSMLNIFFKMLYTMQYRIASVQTDPSHIIIHPETRNFSWLDLHRAKQIIPLGEEAAEEAMTKIKSRLPIFSDYCKVPVRNPRPLSF